MPTLLIIADSMARKEDASGNIQLATAQMYGAYTGAFVKEPERQVILSNKAFDYAKSGSCKLDKKWCGIQSLSNEEFDQLIASLDSEDVATGYSLAVAWLGYMQANSSNWSAVAGLPRAEALMKVVVKYDEAYDNAGAHLYLGALASTIPPALGGKPDVAKAHFVRGIELTDGKNLLIKVEYARRYARNMFDKELHHQLLTEVVEANPKQDGLTLMNSWAINEAKLLLAEENDYFD
jgi:hypothetical protein